MLYGKYEARQQEIEKVKTDGIDTKESEMDQTSNGGMHSPWDQQLMSPMFRMGKSKIQNYIQPSIQDQMSYNDTSTLVYSKKHSFVNTPPF